MGFSLFIKPLSVNEAFKGRKYRTKRYDKFISDMMFILPSKIDIPNPEYIKLNIDFGFSSRNSDIDNCCKTFIDCLVKKYGVDDRYIYELNIVKKIVKKNHEYINFEIY